MSILDTARAFADCRGLTRRQVIQRVGQLVREADNAACQLVAMATEIDELKASRNDVRRQLDESGYALDAAKKLATHLEALVHLRDRQIDDLKRKVDVGVKAEHVIAKTQEIDTSEILRHITPMPLHQSPMAAVTDPGQVRAASRGVDDTQPLPRAETPAA